MTYRSANGVCLVQVFHLPLAGVTLFVPWHGSVPAPLRTKRRQVVVRQILRVFTVDAHCRDAIAASIFSVTVAIYQSVPPSLIQAFAFATYSSPHSSGAVMAHHVSRASLAAFNASSVSFICISSSNCTQGRECRACILSLSEFPQSSPCCVRTYHIAIR